MNTELENMKKVLDLFSINTNKNGVIEDEDSLKEVLTRNQFIVKNSMYFGQIAGEPFNAQNVINFYNKNFLPEFKRLEKEHEEEIQRQLAAIEKEENQKQI